MRIFRNKTLTKKSVLRLLAAVAGLGLLGFGGYNAYKWYVASHLEPVDMPAGAIEQTVQQTTDEPDESPVNPDTYEVPAGQPRQITISSRGIKGFIQKVGVDQHNAVAVPGNINLAGWYTNSVLPGDPGVSLLDGHVRGKYNDGIFKELHTVQAGDVIELEYGDRTVRKFEAVSVHDLSIEETTAMQLEPVSGIERQLNLVTCGGRFIKETDSYERRIVVVAKGL